MSEVGPEPLEVLAGELEAAAEQLAARLGSEVERLAREARSDPPPGQESLL
jgi:hypothetical protein